MAWNSYNQNSNNKIKTINTTAIVYSSGYTLRVMRVVNNYIDA